MRTAIKFVVVMSLVLALGMASAFAQGKRSAVLKVPFSFSVENQKMPAGTYQILVENGWMQIRSADGKTAAMVLTLPVSGKTVEGKAQVVFKRYGESYFLGQVWLPEFTSGRQTLESGEERRLQKQTRIAKVIIKLDSRTGR